MSRETTTRIGLLGAGFIGRVHAQTFQAVEGVEITGVYDVDSSLAETLTQEYGVSKVYDSVEALLGSKDVDAVVLGIPNKWHKSLSLQALQAGKHVLLEKPMALNGNDAAEIYAMQRQSNKVFMVAHQMRWQWIHQEIKRYIIEGKFGTIYAAKAGWMRRNGIPGWGSWFTRKAESGGGPLIDIGVHMMDVALYLMGSPKPVSVYGVTYAEFGPRKQGLGNWGTPNWDGFYDVEDLAMALIRMDNGSTLSLETSWAAHTDKHDDVFVRLMGTEGGAVISENNQAVLCGELFNNPCNIDIHTPENAEDARIGLSKHFIECIREEKTPITDAFSGMVNNLIIDAIYASERTQKSVELDWDKIEM